MITQTMVQPSSLLPIGMNIVPLGNVFLFHLTDDLQDRLEDLLDRKKADTLTNEQTAELEGITELSRIFTLINAQIAEKALWCPLKPEDLFENAPVTSVNTAIRQNT
ncbi:hypothetical protein V2H45_14355 [Tumidithrix elongata RA019]|uniref:Uncharacterized protein n=1 Tax=Tumidithrix elongata BACA0141 TaxID=2716417 RepID=A0AAW9Q151_9CYAN|nr:hypothetical protein [Tumidithrix elongata RA019]